MSFRIDYARLTIVLGDRRHRGHLEIIGGSLTAMTQLIDSLRAVDYTVAVEYVHADVSQAWQWNLARSKNNISAGNAEEFNIRWLVSATQVEAQAGG